MLITANANRGNCDVKVDKRRKQGGLDGKFIHPCSLCIFLRFVFFTHTDMDKVYDGWGSFIIDDCPTK